MQKKTTKILTNKYIKICGPKEAELMLKYQSEYEKENSNINIDWAKHFAEINWPFKKKIPPSLTYAPGNY